MVKLTQKERGQEAQMADKRHCVEHPRAKLHFVSSHLTFDTAYNSTIRDLTYHCRSGKHNVEFSDVLRQSGRSLQRKYSRENDRVVRLDRKIAERASRHKFISPLDEIPKRAPRRRDLIRNQRIINWMNCPLCRTRPLPKELTRAT